MSTRVETTQAVPTVSLSTVLHNNKRNPRTRAFGGGVLVILVLAALLYVASAGSGHLNTHPYVQWQARQAAEKVYGPYSAVRNQPVDGLGLGLWQAKLTAAVRYVVARQAAEAQAQAQTEAAAAAQAEAAAAEAEAQAVASAQVAKRQGTAADEGSSTDRGNAPTSVANDSSYSDTLACIRHHESDTAGGYSAVNPSSGAAGAYQALASTWDGYDGYASAADAPPEVQDQWAIEAIQAAGTRPWAGSGC